MNLLWLLASSNSSSGNQFGIYGQFGSDFGSIILAVITFIAVLVTLYIENRRIFRSEMRLHLDKAHSSLVIALRPTMKFGGLSEPDKRSILEKTIERTIEYRGDSFIDYGLISDIVINHSSPKLNKKFEECVNTFNEISQIKEKLPNLYETADKLIKNEIGLSQCTREELDQKHGSANSCYSYFLRDKLVSQQKPLNPTSQPPNGRNVGSKHLIQDQTDNNILVICDVGEVNALKTKISNLNKKYKAHEEVKNYERLVEEISSNDVELAKQAIDFVDLLGTLLSVISEKPCPYVEKNSIIEKAKRVLQTVRAKDSTGD